MNITLKNCLFVHPPNWQIQLHMSRWEGMVKIMARRATLAPRASNFSAGPAYRWSLIGPIWCAMRGEEQDGTCSNSMLVLGVFWNDKR